MTRSQIDYILAVEKLYSFSKAAEACFVTQSTLSALVSKFEQQIGFPIFDRKTKPITVTKHGEAVLKHLKSINREFLLLDEGISDIKGFEQGHLSIACIPTVSPYLFPMILNKLSESFPNIHFDVRETTTENIMEEIRTGDLDIGIVSTPLGRSDLMEYPLYQEDFLLYDCMGKSKKKNYQVSDIDLSRLWLLEEGHCLRNQVGYICELRQHQKIKGNITYNCGSMFTLIEMVNKNHGVTLLPRLATLNNPQVRAKQLFSFGKPVPVREIGLITHKNFVKKRMLRHLENLIKQEVEVFLKKEEQVQRVAPF